MAAGMTKKSQQNFPKSEVFEYYDLTGPEDVVRLVQEKKVTVKNSFDFIDIEKTLTSVSQVRDGSELNFREASLSLDASSKVYGLRVDNLHGSLMQVTAKLRPEKQIDTNHGSKSPEEIATRRKSNVKKKIRSNYVAGSLSQTTGSIDIDWDMSNFRGEILSRVNGQEGSMGRIMSFLPPIDLHPIDITQQNPWFEEGFVENVYILSSVPEVPLGLPISSTLENIHMDSLPEAYWAQQNSQMSSKANDVHEFKFDRRTYDADVPDLTILNDVENEKSAHSVNDSSAKCFTIDGTPIKASRVRGRPRKPIEQSFVPFLHSASQYGDQSEQPEKADPFSDVVPSLAQASIRLTNSMLIKFATNYKNLVFVDPLNIAGLVHKTRTTHFCTLFSFENYEVPVQELSVNPDRLDPLDVVVKRNDADDPKSNISLHTLKRELPQDPGVSQGVTDEDPVKAPGLIAVSTFVASLPARKNFDMLQIRQAMWEVLELALGAKSSPSKISSKIYLFSQLYQTMQPKLSPRNRGVVNAHLAFVALLSLANERKLKLIPFGETDARIQHMAVFNPLSTGVTTPTGSKRRIHSDSKMITGATPAKRRRDRFDDDQSNDIGRC